MLLMPQSFSTEPAVDNACVKTQQRAAIEQEPRQMLFFPAVEIFRQPGKALAQVVCGENSGAVVPGCLGIGQPLYRRGEKHGIERQYGIHVAGNLRQQQACREVDQERDR